MKRLLAVLLLLGVCSLYAEPALFFRLKVSYTCPRYLQGYDANNYPVYTQRTEFQGYNFLSASVVASKRGVTSVGPNSFTVGQYLFREPSSGDGFGGYMSYYYDGAWYYENMPDARPLFSTQSGNWNVIGGGSGSSLSSALVLNPTDPFNQNAGIAPISWNNSETPSGGGGGGVPPSSDEPSKKEFMFGFFDSDGLYHIGEVRDTPLMEGGSIRELYDCGTVLDSQTPLLYWQPTDTGKGEMKSGYLDPYRMLFTPDPYWDTPSTPDNPSSGSTDLSPVTTRLDSVLQSEAAFHSALLSAVGPSLGSWVYDTKISAAELARLASSIGLDLAAIRQSVQNPPPVNVVVTPSEQTPLDLSSVNQRLDNITQAVTDNKVEVDDTYTAPTLPDLPGPFEADEEALSQVNHISGWFETTDPSVPVQGLSSLLTTLAGRIPSVGYRQQWFTVNFEIPFVGTINKDFSWNDFPMAPLIRTFLVFCLFIFFAVHLYQFVLKVLI